MILYFADRKMNILGQASTSLPEGVIISNDRKTEEVDEGVAILEFDLEYDPEWRKKAETWTEAGNYILRKDGDDREFYTIISREKDPVNGSVNDIYAEDAGLDLLNEVVGAYKADKAYSAEFYIKKFSYDSGFEVGVNEVSNLTRKLSWDGEATATERLLSIATQFNNAEISFSFDVDRMSVVHKYINIFKRRGVNSGVQLQIGREIKKIRIKDTIEDLATAYVCTGGIPDGKDDPITLAGYKYDDGDFYVEGTHLNSRKALQKWSRYQIKTETGDNVGHIVKTFSYDTTSQSELCNRAVSSLKKICDVNTTYEVELSYLPQGTKIGDTVYIIDHTGELYLSSRLLKIETSVCDNTKTAELGEYSAKSSGVSEELRELADAFAKVAQNRKFYTWIAYADDDIGTGASLDSYGKEYLGIASNRVTRDPDLTDPTVYTWVRIRGEQGIPGTSGKDGKTSYFHVKYSDVEKPASYSDMTETPSKYIGTYVDYELEDSKDPSKYTWSKFQGEDGADGVAGKNGENGETSYVHFAYATSEDGKANFSTTDPTDKTYIGQYVDFKKVDSEQPEKYRWSKFQGPKGPAGSDGEQGYGIVASVTRENFTEDQWNSTYGMTGHLASWTGTSTLRNGCRIGDIFVVVGTAADTKNAHTAYYRSDTDAGDLQGICIGHTIAFRGSAGIDGTDGKGIESIKEHYAVSTSNTVTPTSWLDDVPVTNPVNKYLWNYETITYTNGASADSKKRVIGVYGDTGKDGAKGEDGDDFRWNLVKGSSMTNGTRLVSDGTNCMNNVNTNVYENDGFHIITPSSGNKNNGIGFVYNDFSTLGIKPGDTLTFSCDVKGTSDTNKPFIRLHFQASGTQWYDSGHLESLDGQFTPTADFKRVSVTYTLPDKDVYKSKRMWLAIHGNYASDLYIRNIKLELGSPSTPWSPHPDDLVGADGKGIKSTAVTYQASTSGTVIPTGTWQTNIPTVSAGQYLWTRTVITYTDDSKSTSYSVGRMGTNGTNGTNGSAGRGIKSTAITYQAGSSGTTAPTGTWQTTVPATSASSPYLWTRTIITYTDDTTSTSYAVGSTLEGVSVGGRNLARKTSNKYCAAFNSFNGGDNICPNLATVSTAGLTVGDKVTVRLVYKYTNIVAVTGKTAAAWLQGAGNITEWKSGTFVSNQRIALSGSGEKVIKYSFVITSDMIKNQCWYVNIRHDGIQSGSVQWKEFKVEKGNIATDWSPAPEDGIASVDVEYYLSNSATALSGGSWSTTAPTWVNGKYMWSRTVTTDGAGNKTYSPNQNGVCIAGAKGDTGATGATGKGVTSIVEQYYKSTSATALSGGSWGTTYPGWESGKYIWTRSVITYTDNTTFTTTAICVTGSDGRDGVNGTNLWINPLFESDKPQIGTRDTSIKAPNGSAVNLIDKRDNYNSNANFPVFPGHSYRITVHRKKKSGSVNLKAGIWYIAQTSGHSFDTYVAEASTKNLSDGWQEAVYNITCPNGKSKGCVFLQLEKTSTTDTDAAWYVANIICTDITGLKGDKGDTGATGATGATGSQGYGIVANVVRENFTETQWSTYGAIGHEENWTNTSGTRNGCRVGDIFTITGNATDTRSAHVAYYKSTTASGDLHGICMSHTIAPRGATGPQGATGPKGDGLDVKDTRATNESPSWYMKNYPRTTVMEFKECKAIGLSNVGTYCNLQTIVIWGDSSGGYPRQTAKIEGTGKEYWRVGTSNTTWSSWIDPYGKSIEAAKTATNFMEFNSGTGLQIGDKTNGSWKGFRSRITSTAFEILNEAGAAVASYGRKLIQLGKDSVDAVIELCGGKGSIKHENVGVYGETKSTLTVNGVNLGLLADDSVIIRSERVDGDNTTYTSQIYMTKGRIDIATFTELEDGTVTSSNGVDIDDNIGIDIGVPGATETALSKARINGRSLLDFLHPVGSIYMSTSATNPTNLFGGTWVAWGAGRVPVGFNGGDGNFNSSEKTGGSKTINIQHNHGLSNARAAVGRADSSTSTISYTAGGNPHNVYFDREFSYWGGIAGVSKHATDTAKIYGNTDNGGSTAASVLQPYITCYMWKRTA